MNKIRNNKLSLAAIAIAVSSIISGAAYAAASAEDADEVKVKGSSVKEQVSVKLKAEKKSAPAHPLNNFSYRLIEIMNSQASLNYIQKPQVADVSTFPMRLQRKIDFNFFQSSPSFPIRPNAKDLSCFYDVPPYRVPLNYDVNSTPIKVTSDKVSGDINNKEGVLTYTGDVYVTQGDKRIHTEEAVYEGKNKTITTNGDSIMNSPEYTVRTHDSVTTHMQDKLIEITNSIFKFNGSVLRGTAQKHTVDNVENVQTFKNASITSCPSDESTWHMTATTVEIDRDEAFGSAWNDVVYFGPMPVFYFPYINFPLTKDRKTGLLPAEVKYSKSGSGSSGGRISYYQPVYLNLAPNYDATLTPAYDAKHKKYLGAEFRFMPFKNFSGTIRGSYLPNDPSWNPSINEDSHKRWFLHINSGLTLLEDNSLSFGVYYSKVRKDDYNYINDFDSERHGLTDTALTQSFSVRYSQDKYDLSAEVREYQSLINPASTSYRTFALRPQLKASAYETLGPVSFTLDSEFTRFNQDNIDGYRSVNATRAHLEPSLNYHAFDYYGVQLDFGLTGLLTHYNQGELRDLPSSYTSYLGYKDLQDSKTRALYHFSADLKTKLERKVLDMRHTQTLEPEIKYQYIPYRDQSMIALYDTTTRFEDYYTLFSHYKFSGIDRICNMNRLTAGFTSRLLDAHDRETVRFGIAQAFRFSPERVTLSSSDTYSTFKRSNINAIFDARIFDGISFHAAGSYSEDTKDFDNYSASIRYANSSGFNAGASYIFAKNLNYYLDEDKKINYGKKVDMKQIGFDFGYRFNSNWKIVGAMYRDMEQKFNVDSKIALKYDDCCWSVALMYEQYIKLDSNSKVVQDKTFGISFEFRGFYELKIRGVDNPTNQSTHFIPSLDPTSLNR